MPQIPGTSEHRLPNINKRTPRSKSLRFSTNSHLSAGTNLTSALDPTLFIRAGTSGNRHLFPIHPTNSTDLFSRSISRMCSHIPTNLEILRHICSSIPTLQYFDISKNNLNELPVDLSLLIHLRTLNCSHNQLTNLPNEFEKLKQLTELDLSFNHFKRVPIIIYTLKHLVQLNCEHNSIKTIDLDFINLNHLKTLIFDHNQLKTLDTIDFNQLKRLEYIHIAHNQLNTFPRNLHKLTYLKNVNLSYNNLTMFPIELLLIETLDVLNLSHNLLTKLPLLFDTRQRTSLIFSIDLSFNQLRRFPEYLLFISLKLDLSNNQILSIPNDVIRKLNYDTNINRELRITNNSLIQSNLPSDILNKESINSNNILPIIRHYFDEQQMNDIARQGFKISITGCEKSGKSALAVCLGEDTPCLSNEKEDRLINIVQFSFHLQTSNTDSLPVTIFDFKENYEYISSLIDTNALQLICINTVEFDQKTPTNIEHVFDKSFNFASYPIIKQLFQILQLLCDKVTKTNGMMIIPIATCIDLYDQRSNQEKIQVLDKINRFFKLYFEFRLDQIKEEIRKIDSLPTISSTLSYRLKMYRSLLNIHTQVESCHPISSMTYQGISELHRTIQSCLFTQKMIFPHVNRIFPTLWADTNRYIQSLADHLPVSYLLWDDFTSYISKKHCLPNLIDDISMALTDQGKIIVLHEIGTTNRVVFLRPLWLADLLSSLFHIDNASKSIDQSYIREYRQHGRIHSDLVRLLWKNLVLEDEHFFHLWIILMRFLLLGYPKLSQVQLKNLSTSTENHPINFDYAIVPTYLPFMNLDKLEEEKRYFYQQTTHHTSVSYRSSMLPMGLFHRYSVSAIFKLELIYNAHWNNFLRGEYVAKQVKFIIETDHQTYINCHCGTNISDTEPFENIWNVLILILNHFEDIFRALAPNNQFNRYVRCPYCTDYSFMGEWMTPKELQGLKLKRCTSCGNDIDTKYLVQPNERKRRNEELLKKIRERKVISILPNVI